MAKPSFEQVQEFFRQVETDKVTSSSFQLFLDGLRRVRPLSLKEYGEMVRHLRCHTSGCAGYHKLESYAHVGGWEVEGCAYKLWLYTICSQCGKETSLRHWGIETGLVKRA